MSNPNPPETPSPAPRWLRWLLVPALVLWIWLQASHLTTAAAGSDSSGYLNSAQLLTEGRLTTPDRIPAELGPDLNRAHFMPLGFWMALQDDHYAPTYPPGLPLHFAGAGMVFGWHWGLWLVIVGGAVGALVLLYLCARELGTSPLLAVAGTAAFALSPLFLFSSFQPMSDTLATTWTLAAFWSALRARRGGGAGWIVTGAVFAVAVLVRPTNALLLPALLILAGTWRDWLSLGLGGLPGAIFFFWLNNRLYGHPLKSGYGDIWAALEWRWFVPTAAHFGHWLARLYPAVFLLLPFALLRGWRPQARVLAALAAWWLPMVVFYAFYNVSHEVWWCLRFILPAIPALVLAALLGAESLARHNPARSGTWLRPAFALVVVGWSVAIFARSNERLEANLIRHYESAYADASHWAAAHLPPNAIVATLNASGSIFYYTPFPILRWDLMTADQFQVYAGRFRQAGRPVYAMLFANEEKPALTGSLSGQWEKIGEVSKVGFWKLSAAP